MAQLWMMRYVSRKLNGTVHPQLSIFIMCLFIANRRIYK